LHGIFRPSRLTCRQGPPRERCETQ
jgi:hypothetical protein